MPPHGMPCSKGLADLHTQTRCPAAGAGLTASYAGSDETEVVASGLRVFLANVTGGLPGSGADGTVLFKALAPSPHVSHLGILF